MRDRGYSVAPLSKRTIREIAHTVREAVKVFVEPSGYLRIDKLLDHMPGALPGFDFEVLTCAEMGDDHARTVPNAKLMQIRRDVYDGMCEGRGRDRFTVAHEMGHLFLHSGRSFARTWDANQKIYRNSEWQADTFASALLIDEQLLAQCGSAADVAQRFGVTDDAARARFKQ